MKTKSFVLIGLISVLALPGMLAAQSLPLELTRAVQAPSADSGPASPQIDRVIPRLPLDPLFGAQAKSCDTCWDGYLECAFGCGGAACIYYYYCEETNPCGYWCFCQPCPW
jgi:hypothetical protein